MSHLRFGAGLALALALLATSHGAQAFCNAMSCDPSKPTQHCQIDKSTQCVLTGHSLYWSSNCVTFSIQQDAALSAGVDYDAAKASLERAFATWTNAACDGGAPSLHFEISDPVTCDKTEYNKTHRNANIVMFREGVWPYEGGEDALGLTRVRFDTEINIGDLYDTDIELNAADEKLSLGQPQSDEVDLDSLITHELGHALGLAHSLDPEATMIAGYVRGSSDLRTLGQDDIDGVCSIYPPDRHAASSNCVPRHGFSKLCAAEQPASEPPVDPPSPDNDEGDGKKSSSCGVSFVRPAHSSGNGLAGVGLAGLVCAWRLRRRK